MYTMDAWVIESVANAYGTYAVVDQAIGFIEDSPITKGMFPMMLLWGLWFSRVQREERRARLMAVIVVCVLAIALGRLLALSLPFRERPFHALVERGIWPPTDALETWSAMPSDHALPFFSLAAGLFLVQRTVGSIALVHATIVVSLPRLYLGHHT